MRSTFKVVVLMAVCFFCAPLSVYMFADSCVQWFGEGLATTITAFLGSFAILLIWALVGEKIEENVK